MATVNQDGSPHNTPFAFVCSGDLEKIYWGSWPKSLHSMNVERTGQLFVVVYDKQVGGGLYIKAENGHSLTGEELEKALEVRNRLRVHEGKEPLSLDYYQGTSPQRLYGAKLFAFWVNLTERGDDGSVVREYRHEIDRQDLLR